VLVLLLAVVVVVVVVVMPLVTWRVIGAVLGLSRACSRDEHTSR
jgi:hypothetical protein